MQTHITFIMHPYLIPTTKRCPNVLPGAKTKHTDETEHGECKGDNECMKVEFLFRL